MKVNKVTMACAMARQNTNQSAVAKEIGLNRMTVNNAYNGKFCTLKTAQRIAWALHVPLIHLLVPND